MSAFVVDNLHISALVAAGLSLPAPDKLTWFVTVPDDLATLDLTETHTRGEPWGPDAIKSAVARRRTLTTGNATDVGAMLLAANVASVNFRYNEDEPEPLFEFEQHAAPFLTAIETLKALNCYEYQSCEPPDWKYSEAHAFCDALRDAAIRALPGYDSAPWEITAHSWQGRVG